MLSNRQTVISGISKRLVERQPSRGKSKRFPLVVPQVKAAREPLKLNYEQTMHLRQAEVDDNLPSPSSNMSEVLLKVRFHQNDLKAGMEPKPGFKLAMNPIAASLESNRDDFLSCGF